MKLGSKLILFLSLLAALSAAQAQDRIQLSGGYAYTGYYYYPAYTGPWTLSSFNGWDTSASVKLFRITPRRLGAAQVGVEGDFGGSSGLTYGGGGPVTTRNAIRTFMAGPRFGARFRRAGLYGHVLFGDLTYKITQTQPGAPPPYGYSYSSDKTYAMALGGGVDLWLTRHFGARLVQVDYLRNNNSEPGYFAHPGQHRNFRILTVATVRFGR